MAPSTSVPRRNHRGSLSGSAHEVGDEPNKWDPPVGQSPHTHDGAALMNFGERRLTSSIMWCTSPSSNSKDCVRRGSRCRQPWNLGVQDGSLVR
ncbi:uncharacterized protein LOC123439902 [Hordeum vulgare subsp. vulgare]|uniref:Predicted protein n=1 Tax=Hordeum vulgare subsp. vulgare TaxID=112509 RepID=F2DT57_HORVV|nr:uncharacterized protein LOC123439902 [Hordeum vulgare subsp. vulgare]BAJ98278.1 predicted protein [Hordeum vulgare subsp. vulgare]